MKKEMNCLDYCANGMNDKIFDFAKSQGGKAIVQAFKKFDVVREEQIKELLVANFSYYMVEAAIGLLGMSKTEKSIIDFMLSIDFDRLHRDLIETVEKNYRSLMARLNKNQRKRLNELFN